MLRFFTSGESHGPCLTAIVEGFPAGVTIDITQINHDLARRQQGYGRGGRMKIEKDEALVRSGVRWGESLGSPITLFIENKDWRNWEKRMSPFAQDRDDKLAVTRPRPGHADLTGVLKYNQRDVRNILERASARETAARVAVEVVTTGLPPGLGSFAQWDRKLDGRLGQALLSLQAVKGVEVGLGFATARLPGSQVHDEIDFDPRAGFLRRSNNPGGTEGGMSTGEPLRVRVAFKPLSTLMRPLRSVDINTKEAVEATIERSDVCAIPAAAVIAESVVAFVLAQAFLEKFGGDSLVEIQRNYEGYLEQVRHF